MYGSVLHNLCTLVVLSNFCAQVVLRNFVLSKLCHELFLNVFFCAENLHAECIIFF